MHAPCTERRPASLHLYIHTRALIDWRKSWHGECSRGRRQPGARRLGVHPSRLSTSAEGPWASTRNESGLDAQVLPTICISSVIAVCV